MSRAQATQHPIHRALKWQKLLQDGPDLTKAQIAAREGLSRARVTQVMTLLRLPEHVQEHLRVLTTPTEVRRFSVRRLLRVAASTGVESQNRAWQELLECANS